MIRCLTLTVTFALGAAVLMPSHANTASKNSAHSATASHLASVTHKIARSGYIIASS